MVGSVLKVYVSLDQPLLFSSEPISRTVDTLVFLTFLYL
jgi:hypothetical protein